MNYTVIAFFLVTQLEGSLLYAAPPIPFGGWELDNNQVTSECPNDFSCTFEEQFDGIFQRTITDKSGKSFIQQIIWDKTVFESESFTNSTDQHTSGISLKQTIAHPDTVTTAILNTGWADTNNTTLLLNQTITSMEAPNENFKSEFNYAGSRDPLYRNDGFFLKIRQQVNNFFQMGNFPTLGSLGKQIFSFRKAAGNYVKNPGEISLPCTTIFGALFGGGGFGNGFGNNCTSGRGGPGGSFGGGIGGGFLGTGVTLPGGTVTWNTGDEISVIWIGESGGSNFGGGMGPFGGAGGQFTYQSFINLSNTETGIAYRDVFGIAGPIKWPVEPLGINPIW